MKALEPRASSKRSYSTRDKSEFRSLLVLVTLLIVVAETTLLIWIFKTGEIPGQNASSVTQDKGDAKTLRVSGRIEAEQARVASLVSGKIESILVKEGDSVKQDQLLVALDKSTVSEAIKEANAGIDEARRILNFAAAQKQKLQAKIGKSAVPHTPPLPKIEMPSIPEPEPVQTSSAAVVETPPPRAGILKKSFRVVTAPVRMVLKPLTPGAGAADAIKKQIADAQVQAQKAQVRMQVAQAKMQMAQARMQAKMQMAQAKMQAKAQRDAQEMMLGQVNSQILLAESGLEKARGMKRQIELKDKQFNVLSPISGVCTNLLVHKGDVAQAGRPLMLVSDLKNSYVRAFVPESRVALVKTGQEARVYLDLAGGKRKVLKGHVSAIDQTASFTPENIYFQEDRVKQVFGIKIRIDNPDEAAKPGMPCDAEILTDKKSSLANKS